MLTKFFAIFAFVFFVFAFTAGDAYAGCDNRYSRRGDNPLECRLESAAADVGAATVRGFGILPVAGSQMLATWALFQGQRTLFGGGIPGTTGERAARSCAPHDIGCRTREAQRRALLDARAQVGAEAEAAAYERYFQQELNRLRQRY